MMQSYTLLGTVSVTSGLYGLPSQVSYLRCDSPVQCSGNYSCYALTLAWCGGEGGVMMLLVRHWTLSASSITLEQSKGCATLTL